MNTSSRYRSALHTMAALGLALAVISAVLWASGTPPLPALSAMLRGAVGAPWDTTAHRGVSGGLPVPNELLRSLAKATPLVFTGLAVAVALRAGLFNIGAEGQLLVGGLAAAWCGYALSGLPAPVHLVVALCAGMAAGALWGFVPGLLRAWRGAHEVIVTIMMNYIAIQATHYLVNNPLRDRHTLATATPPVLSTARLWSLEGGANFSAGFFLALAAVAIVAFLLRRTALGFEIRAVGAGGDAARAAGIPVGRIQVIAMTLSGALAGLAGAVEVLGVHHRFYDQFSPGYGFDSIAVAFLGGLNALGVFFSALLFGGLNSGAIYMESYTDTPRQIAMVFQAVVIIAVGARYLRRPAP